MNITTYLEKAYNALAHKGGYNQKHIVIRRI